MKARKERPGARPIRVQLLVKCDYDALEPTNRCRHRNRGGYCCVADALWDYRYNSGRALNVDCSSYEPEG